MRKDLLNFLTLVAFTMFFGTTFMVKTDTNYRKIDEFEKKIEEILSKTQELEYRVQFDPGEIREFKNYEGVLTD